MSPPYLTSNTHTFLLPLHTCVRACVCVRVRVCVCVSLYEWENVCERERVCQPVSGNVQWGERLCPATHVRVGPGLQQDLTDAAVLLLSRQVQRRETRRLGEWGNGVPGMGE